MNNTFRKLLSLTLCLIMVLGSVAVGGDGIAELFDDFAVKANAEETGYKAGDSIYLGKYPQSEITNITGLTKDVDYVVVTDTSTSTDRYYAIEPIEWKVLDAETGLCVSNYALNAMSFDDGSHDYEASNIRAWLYGADGTGTFYTNVFTDTEKTAILSNNIVTYKFYSTDVDSTVNDKVFLLSIEEASEPLYFADDSARICYPTDYAIVNNANTDDNNACWWWLRSPGRNSNRAAYVSGRGGVYSRGYAVSNDDGCVRPALYLNLKSEICKTEITSYMVEDIPDCKYTGEESKPTVIVKNGEKTLTENTDYTVAYSNNINAGTATVTINGIGKYKGTVIETFEIKKADKSLPTGITSADETKCSANDGIISGLSTDMEIAFERGEYTPCISETMTGLVPGSYSIRYAESANYVVSDSVQVVIKEGDCYGGTATCINKAVCDGCHKEYGEIDSNNHAFNKVEFTWSKSYDVCTAKFTCQNDTSHAKEVKCDVKKEITTEPTCTTQGEYTCTATVNFEGKTYTDVQKYSIPVKEHEWNDFYTVDKEPTLAETGYKSIHCKHCKATKDGTVIPELEIIINVGEGVTFDFGTKVTIVATAENVEDGYHLEMTVNGNTYKGDRNKVTSDEFELKSDTNYTVKVVKDDTGEEEANLTKQGGTIKCNAGFFKKLIAFFKGLFGLLSTETVQPNNFA